MINCYLNFGIFFRNSKEGYFPLVDYSLLPKIFNVVLVVRNF